MIKMEILSISDVILSLIRNILYGDLSEKNRNFTEKLFIMLRNNLVFIKKQPELSQMLFFKALRLYSGFCYINEQINIKRVLLDVITEVWKSKKQEIMGMGRELMRVLQENFRHNVR